MIKVVIVNFTGVGVPKIVTGVATASSDEKQGGPKPALGLVKSD